MCKDCTPKTTFAHLFADEIYINLQKQEKIKPLNMAKNSYLQRFFNWCAQWESNPRPTHSECAILFSNFND